MNQAIKILERCVEQGKSVLIENLENAIDASIQPIYARQIIKRGRTSIIKMGDKELTLDPKFNLFLHTKLSNPHYPPEIQAEATLINFTVTEAGLEDQLLTLVVRKERPDLAAKKEELIQQQNQFKITLKNLEDDLLQRLADATGDILENYDLIENLERSKALSTEINAKVEIARPSTNADTPINGLQLFMSTMMFDLHFKQWEMFVYSGSTFFIMVVSYENVQNHFKTKFKVTSVRPRPSPNFWRYGIYIKIFFFSNLKVWG